MELDEFIELVATEPALTVVRNVSPVSGEVLERARCGACSGSRRRHHGAVEGLNMIG